MNTNKVRVQKIRGDQQTLAAVDEGMMSMVMQEETDRKRITWSLTFAEIIQ